ncbi:MULTISPECIES: hypothetical protein, partial [unclassified Caballeronia]|uniref:hypothetical protein n=1 Tax=unclassified Caballeronia TaxID=2646786 RepID=UPI002028AAB6
MAGILIAEISRPELLNLAESYRSIWTYAREPLHQTKKPAIGDWIARSEETIVPDPKRRSVVCSMLQLRISDEGDRPFRDRDRRFRQRDRPFR